jgi:ribosomal protein L11 methyltransferase
MLKGKYKNYSDLHIYILKNTHPELKNLEDEDLIGVWEEDGVGVLFFHKPKDALIKELSRKYNLELEEKDVVPYEKWNENRFPKPIKIGSFRIAPVWYEGEWDLIFDPSVVFGEGHHPTTAMMLELSWEFYQKIGKPQKVLDIGCGSGLLTLFWAKLGAKVTAIDINPLCVKVTRNNLALNQLLNKAEVLEGDIKKFLPLKADLVLGNLYKGLLLDLFGLPSFWSSPYYLVSGFSPAMEKELREALTPYSVDIVARKERENWVCWLLKNNMVKEEG